MSGLKGLVVLLILAFFSGIGFIICCGTTGSVDEDNDDDDSQQDDDDTTVDDDIDDDIDDDTDDDADDDTDDDDADDDTYIDCANQDNLGWNEGNTSPNFTLTDEEGNSLDLYDLCYNVVLVVSSTGWCPNCTYEAQHIVADIYNQYPDQPLKIFYTLFEDSDGNAPSQTYLQNYKSTYGFPFHVYGDPYCKACHYQDTYPQLWIPFNVVLDKNMIIRYEDSGYSPLVIRYYINQYIDD